MKHESTESIDSTTMTIGHTSVTYAIFNQIVFLLASHCYYLFPGISNVLPSQLSVLNVIFKQATPQWS